MFEGDYRLVFHLAPPLIAPRDPVTGELRKMRFGAWMLPVFRLLKSLRGLRGTAFDPFGYTAERRTERALIAEYEADIERVLAKLSPANWSKVFVAMHTGLDRGVQFGLRWSQVDFQTRTINADDMMPSRGIGGGDG